MDRVYLEETARELNLGELLEDAPHAASRG
jgi:hypothetical protein